MPTPIDQLSYEEIEQMRAIVRQHDNAGKVNEFDLNNPPKVPYVYREFPDTIYHHETRQAKIVHSAEERSKYLAQGWRRDAYPREEYFGGDLEASDMDEVAIIDRALKAKKKN